MNLVKHGCRNAVHDQTWGSPLHKEGVFLGFLAAKFASGALFTSVPLCVTVKSTNNRAAAMRTGRRCIFAVTTEN